MATERFRFSLGNVEKGQVGLCFDFDIEQDERNEKTALEALKHKLSNILGCPDEPIQVRLRDLDIPDMVVYINPDKITVKDIV